MLLRRALLACTFALSCSAHANLISVATSFGAGTGTVDTATNLLWLDLRLSRDFSYDQLNNVETQAGGIFAGYQFATQAQVNTFINNSGILTQFDSAAKSAFDVFTSTIGVTVTDDISNDGCELAVNGVAAGFNSAGFVSNRQDLTAPSGCQGSGDEVGAFNNLLDASLFDLLPDEVIFDHFPNIAGAWLISPATSAPIPASVLLIALGLPGLWRCRRKL